MRLDVELKLLRFSRYPAGTLQWDSDGPFGELYRLTNRRDATDEAAGWARFDRPAESRSYSLICGVTSMIGLRTSPRPSAPASCSDRYSKKKR